MVKTGSFARDWQLIKLSRDLKPHDISGEVLNRLIEDSDEDVAQKIEEIVVDIGERDGKSVHERMSASMNPETVIEGLLIASGIMYEARGNGRDLVIEISLNEKNIMSSSIKNPKLNIAYITGFATALAPGRIESGDGSIRIYPNQK
ncbi:hypothetical protein [Methanoplanus endosymbiosus]|uniref:Uncharacterized protein n=1 Tax=Methanoplanus endosymbiosus TaxID=33865 RepID=A0A9E7PNA7_9EURY|nr:hypothetical protein [Methanoplanus endosymbiosus]UUX92094.1 hypothetical protein L6E24_12130 [Methanoplanus endosymbiosus]